MAQPILIDTNVLIYLFDLMDETRQHQAQIVLDQLELRQIGRLSVQNLAEFFSVAIRKLTPPLTAAEAYNQINLFTRTWPVFNLTPIIILEAARGVRDHQLSYFDAQLWATARLNQIPVIFSEDFGVGSTLEGVKFVNPFSADFVLDQWL